MQTEASTPTVLHNSCFCSHCTAFRIGTPIDAEGRIQSQSGVLHLHGPQICMAQLTCAPADRRGGRNYGD